MQIHHILIKILAIGMDEMLNRAILSTENYDSLLNRWSSLPLKNNVTFSAGNSKYSAAASDARVELINNFNWTIVDGGLQ